MDNQMLATRSKGLHNRRGGTKFFAQTEIEYYVQRSTLWLYSGLLTKTFDIHSRAIAIFYYKLVHIFASSDLAMVQQEELSQSPYMYRSKSIPPMAGLAKKVVLGNLLCNVDRTRGWLATIRIHLELRKGKDVYLFVTFNDI